MCALSANYFVCWGAYKKISPFALKKFFLCAEEHFVCGEAWVPKKCIRTGKRKISKFYFHYAIVLARQTAKWHHFPHPKSWYRYPPIIKKHSSRTSIDTFFSFFKKCTTHLFFNWHVYFVLELAQSWKFTKELNYKDM